MPHIDRPTRRCALGLLAAAPAVALSWPRAGHAYLLPTPHVLKRAAARLVESKGLTVTFEGTVRPADDAKTPAAPAAPTPTPAQAPAAEVAVTEVWRFGPPLSVEVKAGARAAALGPAGATGDTALLPREPTRQLLSLLFGEADPGAVMLAIGARRDAQSLALVGDDVVHALGAAAGDRRAAQLWVDQSTFAVRRIRFDTDAGPADIRLDGWVGPITEGRFPQRITVTLAGRPVRRLTARAIG